MTIDVENATTVGVGTQRDARGDDGSTRRIDEDARDDCETLITNQAMRSKGWRSSNADGDAARGDVVEERLLLAGEEKRAEVARERAAVERIGEPDPSADLR